jgi:DNA replication and repair protein RecF
LGEYNNLIKTKNEYLKTIDFNNYDKNYIETINYQLAKRAKNIYLERKKFLNKINEKITKINEKLKTFQNIKITMTSAIEIETEEEKIEEKLYLKYNNALFKEIQMNQTLFGPHRDDFIFIVNDNDANEFCSQGQQRMAILMLKLSEIEVFKDVTEEYPVLLLDDVFSELDEEKKKKIINYLYKRMQIIITTTDLNNLDVDVLSNADIFVVKNKKIKKQDRKTEV